ncbi:MAG: response regulator [Bdellovibrionaceae bacterium]|nr:response regulator [Pseudobdellovibrionaceae bacterium]
MFDTNIKVLVVDDMLTMRKIVSKTVKELGFTYVAEAADGALAWQVLCNEPIGIVISDWNMPNCTGIDLLKRVRADDRFKKLPFILVTAEAEATQVAEAVKAGVDNYIVKPFTPDALKKKLAETHQKTAARNAA